MSDDMAVALVLMGIFIGGMLSIGIRGHIERSYARRRR